MCARFLVAILLSSGCSARDQQGNSPPGPTFGCFTASTPVTTPGGERPIGDLVVGDAVIAWNTDEKRAVVRAVTAVYRRTAPRLTVVDLADRRIETTSEHPFYRLSDATWVEAGNLTPGDWLARVTDRGLAPTLVRAVRTVPVPSEVVNLTVGAPEHTFVADSVLVHNKIPTGDTAGVPTTDTTFTFTFSPSYDAQLRFVHLASDAGPVEFRIDGIDGPQLAPAEASSTYVSAPAEAGISVEVRDLAGAPLFDAVTDLAVSRAYTAVTVGAVQQPTAASWPATVRVLDDTTQRGETYPYAPAEHVVTVLHAMPDGRAFDVWVCEGVDADSDGSLDPCDTAAAADGSGLAFGQWTFPLEAPGAQQVVSVAEAGQSAPLRSFALSHPIIGWSYLYLTPEPTDPSGPPAAYHHVRGWPLTWAPEL